MHTGTLLLTKWGKQALPFPNFCWEREGLRRNPGKLEHSSHTSARWLRFSSTQLVSLGASLIKKGVLESNTWQLKFLLICNQ